MMVSANELAVSEIGFLFEGESKYLNTFSVLNQYPLDTMYLAVTMYLTSPLEMIGYSGRKVGNIAANIQGPPNGQ